MLKLCRLSWLAGEVIGYNSEMGPPKDHSIKVLSQLPKQFQRRFLNIFPIVSHVKTMSPDVGGLGWQAQTSDTILKGDHLRTIPTKFGPNWLSSFKREDFVNSFPIGSLMLKLCRLMSVVLVGGRSHRIQF